MFRPNAKKLQAAGIRVHGYWWVDPVGDVNAQVTNCLKIVESARLEGIVVNSIWPDIERWWKNWTDFYNVNAGRVAFNYSMAFSATYLNSFYYAFCFELKRRFAKTGVYTGRGFVTSFAPAMANWLKSFWLWMAQYYKQVAKGTYLTWEEFVKSWLPVRDPDIRNMGITIDNVEGLQFTGDCACLPGSYQYAGSTRRVPMDVSVFAVSFMNTLSDIGNIPTLPQPGPGEPSPMYKVRVITGALNVRNQPNSTTSTIVGKLAQNDVVPIYKESGSYGNTSYNSERWIYLPYTRKV
jgi:hypothetical protein